MMLNEAMFAGYGGWVLKPEGYRSLSKAVEQQHAATQGLLDFSIEFFAGQDIPLPPEHESTKTFKPLVKFEIHPGEGKDRNGEKEVEYKKRTKASKTQDPDFRREVLAFDKMPGIVPEFSFAR